MRVIAVVTLAAASAFNPSNHFPNGDLPSGVRYSVTFTLRVIVTQTLPLARAVCGATKSPQRALFGLYDSTIPGVVGEQFAKSKWQYGNFDGVLTVIPDGRFDQEPSTAFLVDVTQNHRGNRNQQVRRSASNRAKSDPGTNAPVHCWIAVFRRRLNPLKSLGLENHVRPSKE